MSFVYFRSIAEMADESLEVYWLAGFRQLQDGRWFVLVALRGITTGSFFRTQLPIGLLPVLQLGHAFVNGQLSLEPSRGRRGAAEIADVAGGKLITSAEIDPSLYSFGDRCAGVQRLFAYETAQGRILIPVIELVRFLFLHNRTLANTIMRPGALNLLFHPQAPGQTMHRHIRFAKEMPYQSLSRDFVREFAWLAFDEEARRAWESVAIMSRDKDHVLIAPPRIEHSTWEFRGLQHEGTWLVLELLEVTGRRVPCTFIEYSHPKLRRPVRLEGGEGPRSGQKKDRTGGKDQGNGNHSGKKVEVGNADIGAGSNRELAISDVAAKQPSFENATVVKSVSERDRPYRTGSSRSTEAKRNKGSSADRTAQCSPGERADAASGTLPPIEFRLLPPAPLSESGSLELLHETAKCMAQAAPQLAIRSAACFLKEGRAFSVAGRHRRMALVVRIEQSNLPPMVLLDVERTGVPALALLAIQFRRCADDEAVESLAKRVLDGLVDCGGHWSKDVEREIQAICECERLPKALIPRARGGRHAELWAARLLGRLNLISGAT